MASKLMGFFQRVHERVNSQCFVSGYRTKDTFFTRSTAKLPFSRLIAFALSNNRNSAQVAIINLFKELGDIAVVAKQSMFEARLKISHKAFVELFNDNVIAIYEDMELEKWKGYRVIAIDGSVFEVPQSALKDFGGQKTPAGCTAQARAVAFTDVFNQVLISASLQPFKVGERAIAIEMAESFEMGPTDLYIFDRGFYSKEMCVKFSRNGAKYLFRIKSNCQKDIDSANLPDQTISVGGELSLRVVNIVLPNGENVKLATNIFDENFTEADFATLYEARWGVEVNFLMLKERLQIENFTSGKKELVLQDFYAAALVYNLMNIACLLQMEERKKAGVDADNKHTYTPNRNVATHEIRNLMIKAVTEPNAKTRVKALRQAEEIISRFVQPIRPGRNKPRGVKYPSKKFPMNRKGNT